MIEELPRRSFFRFEVPVHYFAPTPPMDGNLAKWDARHLLPPLIELEDQAPFADVYAGWNETHLLVAFDIPNRRGRPICDPRQWWKHDGLRLCVNTRAAPDIRRGTRFCHFFYFLPLGGGSDGKHPVVGMHKLSRARETPPPRDLSRIQVGVQVDRHGYSLEAAIPAECLHGWDPVEHPRIGLFYKIKDTCHGVQHLTVDDELGWNADPSTWADAVLVRD